jgi:hypothetical protein
MRGAIKKVRRDILAADNSVEGIWQELEEIWGRIKKEPPRGEGYSIDADWDDE